MNKPLYERYLQAKADKKAPYARDLATYLNVSEAELTHARVGHDAKRLRNDVQELLKTLSKVGKSKPLLVTISPFTSILVSTLMHVLTITQV